MNMYNSYMGGVDRFNQYVHSQRKSFLGKKWWYPLFAFGLDALCQNAWKIYKRGNNTNILYCEYCRHIVLTYFGRYKIPAQKSVQAGSLLNIRVLPHTRKDNTSKHIKTSCNQSRCANCKKRTFRKCMKCDVPLHLKCWYSFHTK